MEWSLNFSYPLHSLSREQRHLESVKASPISTASATPDHDVCVSILCDTSNSMAENFETKSKIQHAQENLQCILSPLRKGIDYWEYYTFDIDVKEQRKEKLVTDSPVKPVAAVGEATYLYRSICKVLEILKGKESVDANCRRECQRVFIVLTDGMDNDGECERSTYLERIKQLLDEMKSENFKFKLFLIGIDLKDQKDINDMLADNRGEALIGGMHNLTSYCLHIKQHLEKIIVDDNKIDIRWKSSAHNGHLRVFANFLHEFSQLLPNNTEKDKWSQASKRSTTTTNTTINKITETTERAIEP